MEKRHTLIFFALVALALASSASAEILGVTTNKHEVRVGGTLYVEVTVGGDESCGSDVEFYMDNDTKAFSIKRPACETSVQSTNWDWAIKDLDCGTHVARVILKRNGEILGKAEATFDVGNPPTFIITPEQPTVGKDVFITFNDRTNGSTISDVKANIYDKTARTRADYITNDKGTIDYMPSSYGDYEITITDRQYCGRIAFEAKRKTIVIGPQPKTPITGELTSIIVPQGVGVKVLKKDGSLYKNLFTPNSGEVNFTVENAGEYTITVGDLSTQYWPVKLDLTVSDKPTPEVAAWPNLAVGGRTVNISVGDRGQPLGGAAVTVTKPDGDVKQFTTKEDGVILFEDTLVAGNYSVLVSKDRYLNATSQFTVVHMMYAQLTPDKPQTGDSITVRAVDERNTLVSGATVDVDGKSGLTDANGAHTFNLDEVGLYNISVSKDGYVPTDLNVLVGDELSISLSRSDAEIGTVVEAAVFNHLGSPVDANIVVSSPSGDAQEKYASGVQYNPREDGNHSFTAEKEGYVSANAQLRAFRHPVEASISLVYDFLVVNVTSHGYPAAGIPVAIQLPQGGATVMFSTNKSGQAGVEMTAAGPVSVTVNPGGSNRVYASTKADANVEKSYSLGLLVPPVVLIAAVALSLIVLTRVFKMRRKRQKGGKVVSGIYKHGEVSSLARTRERTAADKPKAAAASWPETEEKASSASRGKEGETSPPRRGLMKLKDS
ncbi:Carboxypeptidase regulatory-like domain protein [uncultured archaeon]|nr:Carboxypeptidase regulatory-like domain protein [uncultured archaeon]